MIHIDYEFTLKLAAVVITAVLILALLGALLLDARTPDGWEDQDGFHYGRQERK